MEEIVYPIRDILRKNNNNQKDIAEELKRSRQTVSRYISEYERTGKVGDPAAQKLFDRLMAEENQRLLGEKDTNYRLNMARARRDMLSSKDGNLTKQYENLLKEILTNHPDIKIFDWKGNTVTLETLDLTKMWVNDIDNEQLFKILTDRERKEWEQLAEEQGETFHEMITNSRIENACILEKLWDSTVPNGKPMVYEDTFECVISEEEAGTELYNFGCETFCLYSGSTARIVAEGIWPPQTEHGVGIEVYATISVITDKGLMWMGNVELESAFPHDRYVGQIDNLIPGYKYVYSLGICEGEDGPEDVNKQEYTLREGYYAKESHPLK